MRLKPFREVEKWLTQWLALQGAGNLTSSLKWWFPAMFSFMTKQEAPKPPPHLERFSRPGKVPILIPGSIGRHLKGILRVRRTQLLGLSGSGKVPRDAFRDALTLRFLTKGTARVSEREIDLALEKHRKALCEVEGLRVGRRPLVRQLLWEVRRTARELFGGKVYVPPEAPCFPSRKGHYDSSGLKGGAATVILSKWRAALAHHKDEKAYAACPAEVVHLGSVSDAAQVRFCKAVAKSLKEEMYGVRVECPDGKFRISRVMMASPVAVTEPCKVRVVTKGPEHAYWYLRGIQKFLWRTLSEHPCFELIGKPISEEYLCRRFADTIKSHFFVSGDYVASTDNLLAKLSRAAMRTIALCSGFSGFDESLCVQALIGHTLEYTKKGPDGKKLRRRQRQTNGQLMGSPVSFPILCVVNAAICRHAIESSSEDESLVLLRDAPLAVNGDDCLFTVPDEKGFRTWEKWCAAGGLSSSVGKTYLSRKFVQLNSTSYLVRREPFIGPLPAGSRRGRVVVFEHCPYPNYGMVSPFDPKGGQERTLANLPSLAQQFIEGFGPVERDHLMTFFISQHRSLLATAPQGMSWWLPVHLGGLGLPVTRHLAESAFSQAQLNFATFLMESQKGEGRVLVGDLGSQEKSVPRWWRDGERLVAKYRVRERGSYDPVPSWVQAATVPENEQYFYWVQAARKSFLSEEIVPGRGPNFQSLWRKFSRSRFRGKASAPLATLLGFPAPRMVLPSGISECARMRGLHPIDPLSHISSLVDVAPARSSFAPARRELFVDGVAFSIGGGTVVFKEFSEVQDVLNRDESLREAFRGALD